MMRKPLFQDRSYFNFRFFSCCLSNRHKLAAHNAVKKGDIESLKRELKLGVDANARLKPGDFTLLHRVVLSSNPQNIATMLAMIQLLLDNGADPNEIYRLGKSYFSPLHSAARRALPEVVKVLLKAGAKSNLKNDKGRTALDYAELNNSDRGEQVVSCLGAQV